MHEVSCAHYRGLKPSGPGTRLAKPKLGRRQAPDVDCRGLSLKQKKKQAVPLGLALSLFCAAEVWFTNKKMMMRKALSWLHAILGNGDTRQGSLLHGVSDRHANPISHSGDISLSLDSLQQVAREQGPQENGD